MPSPFAPRGQAQSTATSPASQSATAKPNQPDDAIDDPVLEQADEEDLVPFRNSRVTLKYDHLNTDGGGVFNRGRIYWLQSFGPEKRMAASAEIPLLGFNGASGQPSTNGLGDVKAAFRTIIGRSEDFQHAAEVEFTFPSASDDPLGFNETLFRCVWGFSRQITRNSLLSGNLAYNKAVQTKNGASGSNSLEPELILSQRFAKRFAAFADWDAYYDFNASQLGQTMKLGVVVVLGDKESWSLSPYCQFPLSEFTRRTNLKTDVGFDLSFNF